MNKLANWEELKKNCWKKHTCETLSFETQIVIFSPYKFGCISLFIRVLGETRRNKKKIREFEEGKLMMLRSHNAD